MERVIGGRVALVAALGCAALFGSESAQALNANFGDLRSVLSVKPGKGFSGSSVPVGRPAKVKPPAPKVSAKDPLLSADFDGCYGIYYRSLSSADAANKCRTLIAEKRWLTGDDFGNAMGFIIGV